MEKEMEQEICACCGGGEVDRCCDKCDSAICGDCDKGDYTDQCCVCIPCKEYDKNCDYYGDNIECSSPKKVKVEEKVFCKWHSSTITTFCCTCDRKICEFCEDHVLNESHTYCLDCIDGGWTDRLEFTNIDRSKNIKQQKRRL